MFTATEILTYLGILSVIGGAYLWLMSQYFVTKKQYETDLVDMKARTTALENAHALSQQPINVIVESLRRLEAAFEKAEEKRTEAEGHILAVLGDIQTRVSVLEDDRERRSSTPRKARNRTTK